MKTIKSSNIEWYVRENTEGSVTYCADGGNFVSLEESKDEGGIWWTLCDQGNPVSDINNFGENQTLEEALEIAQNYLASTYNEIFQQWRIK